MSAVSRSVTVHDWVVRIPPDLAAKLQHLGSVHDYLHGKIVNLLRAEADRFDVRVEGEVVIVEENASKMEDDTFVTVHETRSVKVGGKPIEPASIIGMTDQECRAAGVPLMPVPFVKSDEDYQKVGSGLVEPQYGVPGNRLSDEIMAERVKPFSIEPMPRHPQTVDPIHDIAKAAGLPTLPDENDLREAEQQQRRREDCWYAMYCTSFALSTNGTLDRPPMPVWSSQPTIEHYIAMAVAADDDATESPLKTRDELIRIIKQKLGRLG